MQIIELDSFETAFPVRPGKEGSVKRRFMTLFAADEPIRAGGTSYVCKVQSFTGETFALKRLLTSGFAPDNADLTPEDSARITQGRTTAFKEEYRNQLLVSRLRGFPRVYGFGMIGDDPVILMEWVEGLSVRQIGREAASKGELLPGTTIAAIGASVLDVLDEIGHLDSMLVHRDISPSNILVRTTATTIEAQRERGSYDVCLIDFGSASADEEQDASFTMTSQVWRNGTPEYAPPEMLTRDVPNIDRLRKSQSIDVFALCSVLYELYAGYTPWRVADHLEISPYRLKTENPPEPLIPREAADEALVSAIISGLAVEQSMRPSVRELFDALRAYLRAQGVADGVAPGALPSASANEVPPAQATSEAVLPAELYTPDSAHLEMASTQEGGGRASEDVPEFEPRSKGITRRQFVAGGLAVAAITILGSGFAVRSCAPESEFDFSSYAMADGIWEDGPLYPAMLFGSSSWALFRQGVGSGALLETDREPGRFCCGLIRAFDATSNGYGFMTAVQGSGQAALSAAWRLLPTYSDATDFSQTDGLAAVQDKRTGLWGFIDETGRYQIEPAFERAGCFSNGFAAVIAAGEELWCLIDANGKRQGSGRFQKLGLCSEEGLAAAKLPDGDGWVFADADGNALFDVAFRRVQRFSEGLAACVLDDEAGLWGYIDAEGNQVIAPRFAAAYPFADGLAPAQDVATKLWGLINVAGEWAGAAGVPRFLSMGEKTGELFGAHGSPNYDYDVESKAWEQYLDEGNDDIKFAYGYIDAAENWVFKPSFGDTLIRQPEQ